MGLFEYLKEKPDLMAVFSSCLEQVIHPENATISSAYGFGRFSRIVDVGGDARGFLAADTHHLAGRPGALQAVFYDQPHVTAAPTYLASAVRSPEWVTGPGQERVDGKEVSGGLLHPRRIGWVGTTSLALGGSNQSLFLLGALVVSQGTAAIPLLVAGLLLSWAAAFGWTELVLMWPDRVGGIAATCAEAFRPYSAVLANLTGVCYWWGWVPTCGLTAILSASALHQWYLPGVPVTALAVVIIVVFTLLNFCGVKWVARVAMPVAAASALLAFLSALVPVVSGHLSPGCKRRVFI